MKWSKELPDQSGWWWYRCPDKETGEPTDDIFYINDELELVTVISTTHNYNIPLTEIDQPCWWAGPIEKPTDD